MNKKKLKSNKLWIIIIAAAALTFAVCFFIIKNKDSGHIANIYQDGVCIRSIDLSEVTEDFSFSVTDENGHENIVEVKPGKIRVASANCPDQICVNMGWLEKGVTPIVCMPARLSIQLEYESAAENTEVDVVTR